jgi:hypothetical protein
MNLELFESECRVPILAAIDPGKTGYIIKNDREGHLEAHTMPLDDSNGLDLLGCGEILKGCDLVFMEHPPMNMPGSALTEQGCFSQYMQLYGFLTGIGVAFHTTRPEPWQEYLGLPKKSMVTASIYNKKEHSNLPEKEKEKLKRQATKTWKSFFLDQAKMRFPKQKDIHINASEAFLMYDALRRFYPLNPEQWP